MDKEDGVLKSGDTMTGQLKGIAPVNAEDLTRKDYVDTKVTHEITGTNPDILKMTALTRAEYNGLTPDANTLYVVLD
jgi:hypothetical protein